MNKPAPKEPSMDEILSSIRQIIADDDAAGAPRRPSFQAAPDPMEATPAQPFSADAVDRDLADMLEDIEPLALSPAQIVAEPDEDEGDLDIDGLSFDSILADTEIAQGEITASVVQLVETDDVGFDADEPAEPSKPEAARVPVFTPFAEAAAPRPQPTIAQAAPMPDPTLSSDIANQLIEPATNAAVRSSLTKLSGLGLGNASTTTIEGLMKDMLRPMLKEWLDENLPSVVERMVEREIARISRGE
jgi:uncharacterized protein